MRRTPPVVPNKLGLGDLTLMSRGLVIAPRPWTAQHISITHTPGSTHSYTHTPVEGQGAGEPRKTALQSDSVSLVQSAPDEHLSLEEIKALLPRRLGERLEDVRAAFKALDPEGSGSVTRGEFRQVVEAFLFPLTQTQLNTMLAKVSKRDSVTVDYMDFLRRYSRVTTAQRPYSSTAQRPYSSTAQRPYSSTAQRPYSSTAQRPYSSTAQRPYSSTAQRPYSSTAQRPYSSTASSTAQRPYSSKASSTAQRPDSYHRCVSGSDQRGMTLTEIQQRLKHKIGSNLKNVIRAFRLFDYNRDGQIQQHELRRILENYCFPLSQRDYQRLWTHHSPNNMATMSYKVFLEKLGLESNKCRKLVPEPPKLALGWQEISPPDKIKLRNRALSQNATGDTQEIQGLTQDELQTLFLEKLCVSCTLVWRALQAFDVTHSGLVSQEDLRAVLSSFLFPMSLSTFQSLTCRFGVRATGPVKWKQFLGQFQGPVTEEDDTTPQTERVPELSAAEEGHRSLTEFYPILRRAFKQLDRGSWSSRMEPHTPRPRLSPAQVRELLILLDPEHTGVITQPSLELLKPRRVHSSPGREKLHTPTGGLKEEVMEDAAQTAEDCLGVIKEKIENIHGDILSAFRVMDQNCDRVVDRHDFRELYDSLGLVTKEREYQRLLQLLGLQPGANLNYPEFFTLVQSSGKTRRQNFKPANGPDQLHDHLVSNARHRWTAMSKVICRFDEDAQGLVFKKDLRSLLYTYDLPISPDEFEELWARYDGEGRGYLTCAAFLEKLGVDQQEVGHARKDADTTPTDGLPVGATLQDVERLVQGNCEGLSSALTRLDKKREGLVRVEDLQSLLQRYNCPLHRHQLTHLLHTLKVPMDSEDRTLSYVDFLKAFDHVTGKGCEHPPRTCGSPDPAESLEWLSPERAAGRIRELVTASMDILHKAFSAFDRSGNGTVTPLEFRRVLDHFCARLSDPQFRFLLDRMKLNWENRTVYWRDFLNQFNLCNLDNPEDWSDRVGKAGFPAQPQPLPISEEVVSACLYTITKEIVDLEHTHNDTISKEDFRMMCDRHFMRLTSDQFERVWEKLPVNVLGDLEYREFLKHASGAVAIRDKTTDPEDISPLKSASPPSPGLIDMSPSPPSPGAIDRMSSSPPALQRPKTTGSNLQRSKSEVGVSSRARRPSTAGREKEGPLVDCEEVERRLKGEVQRCWRDIQRRCREEDRERDGEISTRCFLDILQSLNVSVTQKELDRLAVKFDMRDSGRVSYLDFLRHFLLNLEPPAVRQPFERAKLPLSTTPMSGGVLSRQCVEAMLRLYGPVQQFWRSLRQNFVTFDHNRSGKISIKEFRKVLRQFRVNLSEEEFFHLTSFFDKNTTGKISYNDFLQGFLH
ncbi:EF-hand calcium-binding domain-containing protein 6 [Oncorhynchus masou masou]|uniref:EF-hand calcium-binding domain-containing protein 6 n=1 Tax=Oncorhynchus masou masou TaxID=90313 RepID=UPI003183AFE1